MKFRISAHATRVAACALVFGGVAAASAGDEVVEEQIDLTGYYEVWQQCNTYKNAWPTSEKKQLKGNIIHKPDPYNKQADRFYMVLENLGGTQKVFYKGEIQVTYVVRPNIASDKLDDFTWAHGYANSCKGTFDDPNIEVAHGSFAYGESITIDYKHDATHFAGTSTYGTSYRPINNGKQPPVETGICTYRFTYKGPVKDFQPCTYW